MLRSLASHVAVALECALARDTAEVYRRRSREKQRDHLGLLLEINNHIVTKLELNGALSGRGSVDVAFWQRSDLVVAP